MTGCSFKTPPAANAACGFSALSLYFKCGTFFETAKWEFENVSSPQFDFTEDLSEFFSNKGGIMLLGKFIDEGMSEMKITFQWKETNSEEVEVDKSVYRMYLVETKP